MSRGVKNILVKTFLFLFPLIVLTAGYLWYDPFKVLYHYDNYLPPGDPIARNRDFGSMEVFLNNYPKYKFDSYIFGNSISFFYEANDWQPYIKTDLSKIYHFDASAESLYGIRQKILFLKERNVPLRNCLIILDYVTLSKTENQEGHITRKHYLLTGENKFNFQFLFFKAYLDPSFLRAYYDFRLTHRFKPYMQKVMTRQVFDNNTENNELQLKSAEESIAKGTYYVNKKLKSFGRKDTLTTKIAPPVIGQKQLTLLSDIKTVFAEESTDFRIIINPLYSQEYFNPGDVKKLKDIFGKENVFDFSGKNKFTEDYHNYYDRSHYRPVVSREILRIIYAEHP